GLCEHTAHDVQEGVALRRLRAEFALLRRHLAVADQLLHRLPQLAVLEQGGVILEAAEGDAGLFLLVAVTLNAVLLQKRHAVLCERQGRLLRVGHFLVGGRASMEADGAGKSAGTQRGQEEQTRRHRHLSGRRDQAGRGNRGLPVAGRQARSVNRDSSPWYHTAAPAFGPREMSLSGRGRRKTTRFRSGPERARFSQAFYTLHGGSVPSGWFPFSNHCPGAVPDEHLPVHAGRLRPGLRGGP